MSTRIKKLCGAFFVFGILVILGLVTLEIQTRPVSKTSELISFEVVQGDSSKDILVKLRSENLIRSQFFTKVKQVLMGRPKMYVGTYHLNRNWSAGDILSHMNKMTNVDGAHTVKILLKEGFWAKDMAQVISESTTVSKETLLETWNDREYVSQLVSTYEHLPQELLNNDSARILLEGYLYPDTYDFYRETTPEAITEKILDNGLKKYLELKDDMAKAPLNHHEMVTLASIVEYEANKDDDLKLVAGVFLNRLAIDMKLQSSVTVCYSIYDYTDWKECESAANNQIDSPYNTYRHPGLPPGPILNPSNRALKAVLNPTPSKYLFFIADVYGDGTVYYSETFEQHQKYIDKYLGGH